MKVAKKPALKNTSKLVEKSVKSSKAGSKNNLLASPSNSVVSDVSDELYSASPQVFMSANTRNGENSRNLSLQFPLQGKRAATAVVKRPDNRSLLSSDFSNITLRGSRIEISPCEEFSAIFSGVPVTSSPLVSRTPPLDSLSITSTTMSANTVRTDIRTVDTPPPDLVSQNMSIVATENLAENPVSVASVHGSDSNSARPGLTPTVGLQVANPVNLEGSFVAHGSRHGSSQVLVPNNLSRPDNIVRVSCCIVGCSGTFVNNDAWLNHLKSKHLDDTFIDLLTNSTSFSGCIERTLVSRLLKENRFLCLDCRVTYKRTIRCLCGFKYNRDIDQLGLYKECIYSRITDISARIDNAAQILDHTMNNSNPLEDGIFNPIDTSSSEAITSSFLTILKAKVLTIASIPKKVLLEVTTELTAITNRICNEPENLQFLALLLMFPKLVLFKIDKKDLNPKRRKKLQVESIRDRLKRFKAGGNSLKSLFTETLSLQRQTVPITDNNT